VYFRQKEQLVERSNSENKFGMFKKQKKEGWACMVALPISATWEAEIGISNFKAKSRQKSYAR
jgi:hypothetical protein